MRTIRHGAMIAAGGVLCALAAFLLLALPGLASDQASTVPVHVTRRPQR